MSRGPGTCCICLDSLVVGLDGKDCGSLACGHIVHKSCLIPIMNTFGDCPICRTPIDIDRIRPAQEVPGALHRVNGPALHSYAARSTPAARTLANQARRTRFNILPASPISQTDHEAHTANSAGDPRAGLMERLGATLRAATLKQHAGVKPPDDLYVFCLDVSGENVGNIVYYQTFRGGKVVHPWLWACRPSLSGALLCQTYLTWICRHSAASMGSLYPFDWNPRRCSRIAAAITAMAAYIDAVLEPRNRLVVYAFDHSVRIVLDWRTKGTEFCALCFMDDLRRRVASMDRRGTALYSAVISCCQALEGVYLPEGAEGTLIMVTDGEAMDPKSFEDARAAVCNPPAPMRMLLLHIDPSGFHSSVEHSPKALGSGKDGHAVEHFAYVEVPLPSMMNSSTVAGRARLDHMGEALSSVCMLPSSGRRITPMVA